MMKDECGMMSDEKKEAGGAGLLPRALSVESAGESVVAQAFQPARLGPTEKFAR
jgi:hypothetical protein